MNRMNAPQLKKAFVDFFKSKSHEEIPSVSVVPEGDSSTLFISAGMHPLVPYLLGEPHPLGKRLVDVQECVRTGDIDEVGDPHHHTWFEMLGNWSLGDYFKKEAISWSGEFLTEVLKIKKKDLWFTCFAGDDDASRDVDSAKAWESLGIDKKRIFFLPKKENWWGPVSDTGPCGPDTEIFVDTGKKPCSKDCRPWCDCGKYVEIWNNVFMEFNKTSDGQYKPLANKNVDTGMGLERMIAILNGLEDDYLTDIWQPIIKSIQAISDLSYEEDKNKRAMRIIADHTRAAVFIIADGVVPGNKEQGYVLRKLIRRTIRQGKFLGIEVDFVKQVAEAVIKNRGNYGGNYPELEENRRLIFDVLQKEESKFRKTINKGLKEIDLMISRQDGKKMLSGKNAFHLYETFGFPLELIKEEVKSRNLSVDEEGFLKAQKKHQEKSSTAAKGRFKGGLAGRSDKVIRYHTATHLLQSALRQVLGDQVTQSGSNLTRERLRFDFTYADKPSSLQLQKVEQLVNQKIKKGIRVALQMMPLEKAKKSGALVVPGRKYPGKVTVYSIGDFSREICAGPHVDSTKKLGIFKITKEESCGAGKRRIYAVLRN